MVYKPCPGEAGTTECLKCSPVERCTCLCLDTLTFITDADETWKKRSLVSLIIENNLKLFYGFTLTTEGEREELKFNNF